jgi:type II secretory pathway pseudopilin PulG
VKNLNLTKAELAIISILLLIISIALAPHIKTIKMNSKNTEVKRNCRSIQGALERFAQDNNGQYPKYATEQNSGSKTLISYLPNQKLLKNPYQKTYSEPDFFRSRKYGASQYKPLISDSKCESYVITGWGNSADSPIIELTNRTVINIASLFN